jgi:transcriptional regulator with XRE-family HTH domain
MTDIRALEPETAARLARDAGRQIRRIRRARRIRQSDVASAIGISQSEVSRVERGRRPGVSLAIVAALCDVLDIRVAFAFSAPYVAGRLSEIGEPTDPVTERQRDAAHARSSAHVRRRLERRGWIVRQEVEVRLGSARGFIDILAFHPPSGTLLIGEIKTEIHDVGDLQRSIAWHEAAAPEVARSLGWQAARFVSCVFVLATESNDERIRANRGLFDQSFPIRRRAFAAWLDDPVHEPPPGCAIVMIDPVTRQRAWLRGVAIDGRRRPAPYRDYRDFMERLSA